MLEVNKTPGVSEVRVFGLTLLGGFTVIGALLWYVGRGPETGWSYSGTGAHVTAVAVWVLGAACAAICCVSHGAGSSLYVFWMTAATYLGIVMSTLLLSLLFFVLLPLFSLIRLKDPLRLRLKRQGSYWEDHDPHEATLERVRRPF